MLEDRSVKPRSEWIIDLLRIHAYKVDAEMRFTHFQWAGTSLPPGLCCHAFDRVHIGELRLLVQILSSLASMLMVEMQKCFVLTTCKTFLSKTLSDTNRASAKSLFIAETLNFDFNECNILKPLFLNNYFTRNKVVLIHQEAVCLKLLVSRRGGEENANGAYCCLLANV